MSTFWVYLHDCFTSFIFLLYGGSRVYSMHFELIIVYPQIILYIFTCNIRTLQLLILSFLLPSLVLLCYTFYSYISYKHIIHRHQLPFHFCFSYNYSVIQKPGSIYTDCQATCLCTSAEEWGLGELGWKGLKSRTRCLVSLCHPLLNGKQFCSEDVSDTNPNDSKT